MIDQNSVFARNEDIVSTEADGTVFALNPEHGHCYLFSGPSARIWGLLEERATLDGLVRVLVSEYAIDEAACREEVAGYLASLQAEELVRAVSDT